MKVKENLLLIFDYPSMFEDNDNNERIDAQNINFAHSLGLKYDDVGWCEIDLTNHQSSAQLDQIEKYAKEHEYFLRGFYSKEYCDFESEWYSLEYDERIYAEMMHVINVMDGNNKKLEMHEIYGYKISKHAPVLIDYPYTLVTEKFRNYCKENDFTGVDFYWARDIGKYDATKYFGLIVDNSVAKFANTRGLDIENEKHRLKYKGTFINRKQYERFNLFDGMLPKISKLFSELQVTLPAVLLSDEMPDEDFAYIYADNDYYILLRKHVAQKLLNEKILTKKNLAPMLVRDTIPEGYVAEKTSKIRYPSDDVVNELLTDYYKLKNNPKPQKKITQTDALKSFRKIKRDHSEDYSKGLSKKEREELVGTPYESMIPYYAIAGSGDFGFDYYLFPLNEARKETIILDSEMEKWETVDNKPEGIVIAEGADGGKVILSADGTVKRLDYGYPDIVSEWNTLADFFYDTLCDED